MTRPTVIAIYLHHLIVEISVKDARSDETIGETVFWKSRGTTTISVIRAYSVRILILGVLKISVKTAWSGLILDTPGVRFVDIGVALT